MCVRERVASLSLSLRGEEGFCVGGGGDNFGCFGCAVDNWRNLELEKRKVRRGTSKVKMTRKDEDETFRLVALRLLTGMWLKVGTAGGFHWLPFSTKQCFFQHDVHAANG